MSLEEGMELILEIASVGHALRKEHKLKVRQPLPALHIVLSGDKGKEFLYLEKELLAHELNVKKVEIHEERRSFVQLAAKPNFPLLGKKVGPHMKELQFMIGQLDQEALSLLESGKSIPLILGGEKFHLTSEDLFLTHVAKTGWAAMQAGSTTIALETKISEDLLLEGIARELVNKINTMRRDARFAVSDRIHVFLGVTEKVRKALEIHKKTIEEEVLAVSISYAPPSGSTPWDINGEPTLIAIERV